MKTQVKLTGTETREELISIANELFLNVSDDMTNSMIIDMINQNTTSSVESNPDDFNINVRFDFLTKIITMVALDYAKSAIVLGDGGLGKTHVSLEAIENSGLPKDKLHIEKGFSTSRALYECLYKHNGKLIMFDDCDSVLEDKTGVNILKGALDSYKHRIITWSISDKVQNNDYPTQFEFTGRVIFISNRKKESIPQPILSRCYVVDLKMTNQEKIDRMSNIFWIVARNENVDNLIMYTALEFLKKNLDKISELNIRTLIKVANIIESNLDNNWEKLAEYIVCDQK